MNCTKKVELNRWEAIIITGLKYDISLTEARKKLAELNMELVGYKFPDSNGDKVNINNILGNPIKEKEQKATDHKNKEVAKFYSKFDIIVDPKLINTKGKNKGELIYLAEMCDEDINIREKILLLNVNKSIFTEPNSIFQKVKNKILEKFERGITNGADRQIAANGKKNTAAAKTIIYNGSTYVLTYEKFEFSDFFNNDFTFKNIDEIVKNINKKIDKIQLIELYEEIEKDFRNKILKEVFEYKNKILVKNLINQELNKLKKTEDLKKLIEIENQILNILNK